MVDAQKTLVERMKTSPPFCETHLILTSSSSPTTLSLDPKLQPSLTSTLHVLVLVTTLYFYTCSSHMVGCISRMIHFAYFSFTHAQNSILTLSPTRKFPWCLHDHELIFPPWNHPSVHFQDKDQEKKNISKLRISNWNTWRTMKHGLSLKYQQSRQIN